MKITITGRKCSPRDSFREHAEKKLAKIERFFGPDVEAKVTVTVEKSSQSVEITVNNNGMVFRAQERAENMNEALDKCVDTLIRQIRKNKTRIEKKLKTGSFDAFADAHAGRLRQMIRQVRDLDHTIVAQCCGKGEEAHGDGRAAEVNQGCQYPASLVAATVTKLTIPATGKNEFRRTCRLRHARTGLLPARRHQGCEKRFENVSFRRKCA